MAARPVHSAVQQSHTSLVSEVPHEVTSVPVAATVVPTTVVPVEMDTQLPHASFGGGKIGHAKAGQVWP